MQTSIARRRSSTRTGRAATRRATTIGHALEFSTWRSLDRLTGVSSNPFAADLCTEPRHPRVLIVEPAVEWERAVARIAAELAHGVEAAAGEDAVAFEATRVAG